MQKIFHHILVPVWLDRASDMTIETAVGFANQLNCHLHIFFISSGPLSQLLKLQRVSVAREKMRILELRQKHRLALNASLRLFTAYQESAQIDGLARYVDDNEIDMMMLARSDRHASFHRKCIGRLHCPVIAMEMEKNRPGLETIVLPIGATFPITKIRIAVYLAKHFHLSLHLLSLEEGSASDSRLFMKRAFELVKNNTDLPVACQFIRGKQLTQTAFEYASANAGIVMMNANNARIRGVFERISALFGSKPLAVPVVMVA